MLMDGLRISITQKENTMANVKLDVAVDNFKKAYVNVTININIEDKWLAMKAKPYKKRKGGKK